MVKAGGRLGVALVTGGAGGIGSAVGAALEERGVRVASFDRRPNPAMSLTVTGDVTDERAVGDAAARVEAELGPVDRLVCAAGVVSEHELAGLTLDEWRRVVDVSLTGTFLAVRSLAPLMAERGRGSIVAFSSGYGTMGYRHGGHYAAAKAGVEAFVKSVAQEYGRAGVRANAVAPGPVLTPFVGHIADQDAWLRDREARIPLGRVAEAHDLVGPVLFLLGEDSGYVTGQVLHVNGGLLMP